MRYTFSCASIDSSCPATFVSDTDVQLLEQVHRHVEEEHPELAKKEPTREKIQQSIKSEKSEN